MLNDMRYFLRQSFFPNRINDIKIIVKLTNLKCYTLEMITYSSNARFINLLRCVPGLFYNLQILENSNSVCITVKSFLKYFQTVNKFVKNYRFLSDY